MTMTAATSHRSSTVRLAGVLLAVAWAMPSWGQRIRDLPPSALGISMPELSAPAIAGQRAFDANCASCHGRFGSGSDKGPPLLHDIYNLGHHADEAFQRAARNGVQQHHWQFGDMPPQPQLSDEQLMQIVRYVRELQRANGIQFKPHRM